VEVTFRQAADVFAAINDGRVIFKKLSRFLRMRVNNLQVLRLLSSTTSSLILATRLSNFDSATIVWVKLARLYEKLFRSVFSSQIV